MRCAVSLIKAKYLFKHWISRLGVTRTVFVLQELREVEELGDELLDVVGVVHEGLPGGRDGVELAVGAVEPERGLTTGEN